MKKTALITVLAITIGAAYAFAHCGNCPGDKKAAPAKAAEVKPAGKNCADCPMHKKAAAAAAKTINCPEAKGAKTHDCAKDCAGNMCPEKLPGASAVVKNTDSGVEIVISAADKETITKIQAAAVPHYAGKDNKCAGCPTTVPGAETKFENLPVGIIVRVTGKTPETIKKIQAAAASEFARPAHKAGQGKSAKPEAKTSKKYNCPMKCVESEKPGKCPKCGMPMEEKK